MSMFRQLLTFLTAATFVAHGLWGCCWFGAQSFQPRERVISRASSRPATCCKHCDHTREKGCPHDGPCKLHCRGVCVYVAPQKCQLDAPQIHLLLEFAAVAFLQTGDDALAATRDFAGADGRREAEPPVRLHLLHQIFLI